MDHASWIFRAHMPSQIGKANVIDTPRKAICIYSKHQLIMPTCLCMNLY